MHSVNVIDDKNLSRHYCFANSTKFLLEKGANPNKLSSNTVDSGKSILMQSISSENPQQCITLLLEHKANINYRDNQGRTALYQAVLIGNPEIVKILLQYGANKDDKYYLLEREIPMSIEKPLSKTVLTSGGTMLMFAVSEGHISVVKELLENGANPIIETKNGLTALSIAKENKNQILIDLLSEYMRKFPTSNKNNNFDIFGDF
jgi:ankyrin repeat protein